MEGLSLSENGLPKAPKTSKYEKAKAMCAMATKHFPQVEKISAEQVISLRDQGKRVVLVDVRTDAEQEVSMLAGAVTRARFEADDFADLKSESLTAPEAVVVPYCTVGYRSGQYAQKLQDMGYTSVRNSEGVLLWTHDVGKGLVHRDRDGAEVEVKRVHVYASPWDAASNAYETVAFNPGSWMGAQARRFCRPQHGLSSTIEVLPSHS